MKLTYNPSVRTASDAHSHSKPKRHFPKLVPLALLGCLSFAPMAIPKSALAQDVDTTVSSSTDSLQSDSNPVLSKDELARKLSSSASNDEFKEGLAAGVDVETRDDKGRTLLISAIEECRSYEICELLINKGANVNAKSNDGTSPLLAAMKCYIDADICKLLIKNGANVNAKSNDGRTPLHLAVAFHHPDLCKLLIENGADVNSKDKDGWSPLRLEESLIIGPMDGPWTKTREMFRNEFIGQTHLWLSLNPIAMEGGLSVPIENITSVPLAIRTVPPHPNDVVNGFTTTGPIGNQSFSVYNPNNEAGIGFSVLGLGASLSIDRMMITLGAILDLDTRASTFAKMERNYPGGDTTGWVGGFGTRMTYYEIHDKLSPRNWIVPYAEGGWWVLPSNLEIGIGYKWDSYEYKMTAANGWDRYGAYEVWKKYDLVDVTINGMFYVFADVGVGVLTGTGIRGYIGWKGLTRTTTFSGWLTDAERAAFVMTPNRPEFVFGLSWWWNHALITNMK